MTDAGHRPPAAFVADDRTLHDLRQTLTQGPQVLGAEVRVQLSTPDEARAYAEQVIRATQRASPDYFAHRPYVVEDRGETWMVIGSGTDSDLLSPLHVELRKSDATVVSYGMSLRTSAMHATPH